MTESTPTGPSRDPSDQTPSRLSSAEVDHRLLPLLESQKRIRANKSKLISFNAPILWQKENPVFFPKTINVIQGKAGVHKSRLAETICAALLNRSGSDVDLLEFKRSVQAQFAICYVDTERNLSDQLPYSLQQIQLKAGYTIEDHPYGFDYISLLEFDRADRFDMLNLYLDYIRQQFSIHLLIVLDVITDCVFNFNDTKDSMKLIDMMNQAINRYDVTFLCLIHENPGSADKARGHLGTEILNKSSTVIQIRFEKDSQNASTDLLKVSYLKCRSSRKHAPFYVQYSDFKKGLELASNSTVQLALGEKFKKAEYSEIMELLPVYLTEPLSKKELFELLCKELSCKMRTIESRIKEITENKLVIATNTSEYFNLCKHVESKQVYYSLVAL